jgi:hypothetical protein
MKRKRLIIAGYLLVGLLYGMYSIKHSREEMGLDARCVMVGYAMIMWPAVVTANLVYSHGGAL